MSEQSFLGQGWGFPPLFPAPEKGPVMVASQTAIQQAIGQIIETDLGTRVMQPQLGSVTQSYLFDSMDFDAVADLKDQVSNAIVEQEPRINLLSVDIDTRALTQGEGRVDLFIEYEIRAVNTRDNLVYPFFIQEAT